MFENHNKNKCTTTLQLHYESKLRLHLIDWVNKIHDHLIWFDLIWFNWISSLQLVVYQFFCNIHWTQDTRETFNEKFQSSAFSIHDSSSILSIKQATEIAFQQCDPPTVPPDVALFNELNTAGSLFSIHSAPPVQLADSINTATEISAVSSDGNGLFQQNLSTKSVFLELIANNKRNSECDEDDNDNLLTVSSVTARPLIAKSHELKSNR